MNKQQTPSTARLIIMNPNHSQFSIILSPPRFTYQKIPASPPPGGGGLGGEGSFPVEKHCARHIHEDTLVH